MYGSEGSINMVSPHIVISSNYILDLTFLSKNPWKIYAIPNKKLEQNTKLIDLILKELRN